MHRTTAKNAVAYVAVWTLFGLFFFSQNVVTTGFWLESPSRVALLISWLTQAYTWALLTPTVLWLSVRVPFAESHRLTHALAHIAASVALALLAVLVVTVIAPRPGADWGDFLRARSLTRLITLPTGFHRDFIAYWIVFGFNYTSVYYRKYRERERRALQLKRDEAALRAQLADAELDRLRRQLQPRTVYGTLEAMARLIGGHQPQRAEELLTALGDLLRCVLDDTHSPTVPLRYELEHVRAYLEVERLRLDGRVLFEIAADPSTLEATVMAASIQPIIQNVLAIIVERAIASIGIRSTRARDLLKIEIEFSAEPQHDIHDRSAPADLGVILDKTRRRLDQIYNGLFRLHAADDNRATIVTLLVPYRIEAGEPDISVQLEGISPNPAGA
jgi:hypothetical protein